MTQGAVWYSASEGGGMPEETQVGVVDEAVELAVTPEVVDSPSADADEEAPAMTNTRAKIAELFGGEGGTGGSPSPEPPTEDDSITIDDIEEDIVKLARSKGWSDEELLKEFNDDLDGAATRWSRFANSAPTEDAKNEQPNSNQQPQQGFDPEQIRAHFGVMSDDEFDSMLEGVGLEPDDPQAKFMRQSHETQKRLADAITTIAGTAHQTSTANQEREFVATADSVISSLEHGKEVYGDQPFSKSSGKFRERRLELMKDAAALINGGRASNFEEAIQKAEKMMSSDHTQSIARERVLRRGKKRTQGRTIDPAATRASAPVQGTGKDDKMPKTRAAIAAAFGS